jgi:hypothetical protein
MLTYDQIPQDRRTIGTTRLASERRASTCATPQRALAMAPAGPPRCGTTPTPYLRLTGEPPPISHS